MPRRWRDILFYSVLGLLGASYVLLIVAVLAADAYYVVKEWRHVPDVLLSDDVLYATKLSLVSSVITTILSLWVAVPIGYLMSRLHPPQHAGAGWTALRWARSVIDAILDIPIVLPPLVIGVSLLILFAQTPVGGWLNAAFIAGTEALFGVLRATLGLDFAPVTGFPYAVPGVILAQFLVAAAFAVRTMRTTFDEITPRKEQVALTLGCTRGQAFWHVVLPEARGGMLAAATLTWARAIGEFGPILVFAGATPGRTQVLPTSVFLQMSIGDLAGAVAVSLMMVLLAIVVLVLVRLIGHRDLRGKRVEE